ncbi:hypothetical protein U0070_011805 [Myodes glareolus]|uniref:Uncharacterized protein n=1 Tax=Myodes glareolus TaxID=447135 RepID=A0AAW0I2H7_MYOGA
MKSHPSLMPSRFQLEASDSQSPDLTGFQTGPRPQPLTLPQAIHELRLISPRKTERQQRHVARTGSSALLRLPAPPSGSLQYVAPPRGRIVRRPEKRLVPWCCRMDRKPREWAQSMSKMLWGVLEISKVVGDIRWEYQDPASGAEAAPEGKEENGAVLSNHEERSLPTNNGSDEEEAIHDDLREAEEGVHAAISAIHPPLQLLVSEGKEHRGGDGDDSKSNTNRPSEVIYQPVEIAQDGGCVPPPLSLMEASVPEPYSDHGVQAAYHQVYASSAIIPAPVMQPQPIKEPRFSSYTLTIAHHHHHHHHHIIIIIIITSSSSSHHHHHHHIIIITSSSSSHHHHHIIIIITSSSSSHHHHHHHIIIIITSSSSHHHHHHIIIITSSSSHHHHHHIIIIIIIITSSSSSVTPVPGDLVPFSGPHVPQLCTHSVTIGFFRGEVSHRSINFSDLLTRQIGTKTKAGDV